MSKQRKSFSTILVLIMILTLTGMNLISDSALAVEKEFIPEIDYTNFELDNGFEIYVVEDDSIPVINYSLYYDVGSINEKSGQTGKAHFLEHMMFLESKNLDKGEFNDIINEVGGESNAMTTHDYTTYYGEVSANMLELIMSLEAERMVNLEFNSNEVEREREVIVQERKTRIQSDIFSKNLEKIQAKAFEDNALEHQVIGWEEDIKSISLEEIKDFYEKYYSPNNAVLVLSGDLDSDEAHELAKEYFGDFKAADIEKNEKLKEKNWKFKAGQELEYKENTQVPIVMMLYDTTAGDHKDQVAIDALLNILVNNKTARVKSELKRDKRLIIETAGLNTKLEVPGYAMTYFVPTNQMNLDKAQKAFDAEIERIINNGLKEEELEIIKNKELKSANFNQRNSESLAELLGLGAANYDNPEFYVEYVESVYNLTEDDIIEAAQKYFDPDNRVIGNIIPNR
ncbi:MAG: M16 family metallopeptidase [Bacillota bacterium]